MQRPAGSLFVEALTFDVFHRDEVSAFHFSDFVNVGDIRMRKRRGGARLLEKAMEALLIARHISRENLQRNIAAELRVPSEINLAHAAFAKLRADFITSESGAGVHTQCHFFCAPQTSPIAAAPILETIGQGAMVELGEWFWLNFFE